MSSGKSPDVVIVGSGIAGGALATVLAASNMSVLTLERQLEYRDHVRGEILWPWGVRAARMVGVEQVLLDAGAQVVSRFDVYDEGTPERVEVGVDEAVDGIAGSLNIAHPRACSALAHAAVSAGAEVRTGMRDFRFETGKRQRVRWTEADGEAHEALCGLVVGADGRRSSVRSQARIALEVDPPAHLIAGLLVETPEGIDNQVNVGARESDLLFYSFPQQSGHSRLYHCFPTGQRSRFAGPDGASRFLEACELDCLERVGRWTTARPAGPCGTFPGEDSRVSSPLVEGVVLIGDAAGYENPLQGQGLSMAIQDVLDLCEALLSEGMSHLDLQGYASRRTVRKRLADLGTVLEVWTNEGCIIQDPDERAARNEFIDGDEVLVKLRSCFMSGFDSLPHDLTHADLADRLAAYG